MLRKVKREELPKGINVYDSNWNKGVIIGNVLIFNAIYRKETKKIKSLYKRDNEKHYLLAEYKGEPVQLKILYLRK